MKFVCVKFAVIFVTLLFQNCSCQPTVVIQTPLGKVEGFVSKSDEGNDFINFVGIPFAKPPIGTLRLRKPIPADPWSGTLKADTYKKCIQFENLLEKKVIGEEDCLVVNIYTPNPELRDRDLLPVMVFIHGGAFYFWSGSRDFFGPERLMDHGVVLVTFNYRLGPLGFMSSSDDVFPGNFGLWDQRMALEFVQGPIF